MLARRDHSRREIQQKLKKAGHLESEIEAALTRATERRWLLDETVLASREANRLARAGKSRPVIEQWLKRKGLPTQSIEWETPLADQEFASALTLAQRAWPRLLRAAVRDCGKTSGRMTTEFSLRNRLQRMLLQRGFTAATARSVFTRLWRENAVL